MALSNQLRRRLLLRAFCLKFLTGMFNLCYYRIGHGRVVLRVNAVVSHEHQCFCSVTGDDCLQFVRIGINQCARMPRMINPQDGVRTPTDMQAQSLKTGEHIKIIAMVACSKNRMSLIAIDMHKPAFASGYAPPQFEGCVNTHTFRK